LKFQAVAEKTAKDARGYFILPHPVVMRYWQTFCAPQLILYFIVLNMIQIKLNSVTFHSMPLILWH